MRGYTYLCIAFGSVRFVRARARPREEEHDAHLRIYVEVHKNRTLVYSCSYRVSLRAYREIHTCPYTYIYICISENDARKRALAKREGKRERDTPI